MTDKEDLQAASVAIHQSKRLFEKRSHHECQPLFEF